MGIGPTLAFFASLLLFAFTVASAQQAESPIPVDENESLQHQTDPRSVVWVDKPAQFHGIVRVQVVVNTRGEVEAAHAIEGFPGVFASAEAAEQKRHFKPFERAGHAVRATFADDVTVCMPEEWLPTHVPFPPIKDWKSLRIKLERLPCYGPCPVYSIEVHGDGQVFYEGTSGLIAVTGHHRDHISQAEVQRLVASFRDADYFSLRDKYATMDTDLPTFVTSIAFDSNKKTVLDYEGFCAGMPLKARQLETLLDQATHSDKWLKGTSELASSLLREHWNFKANSADNYQLFSAAIGHPAILQLYLEHGFPSIESPDPAQSPVVTASFYGNPALLERLIGTRRHISADILVRALAAAAAVGQLSTVDYLIAHGANPNTVPLSSNNFNPPLISAVASGKAAVVERLLQFHPAINVTDAQDEDAISVLLTRTLDKSEDIQILEALIKAGANVNAPDAEYGETPIFKACDVDNSADVLRLLVKAGANVNARDQFGRTPLIGCYDLDCARTLIALGADVSARDNHGRTAAQAAREGHFAEVAEMLDRATARQ